MKSLRRCVLTAGVVALTTAGGVQEAKAAGFANTNAGGEQGTVVATNPMSLLYNPAGMAFAKGSQLGLYGGLALRYASYDRPGASTDIPDPPGAQGANTGMSSLFNAFGGPSIGGTLKVGNLVVGAGFFAPFYGRAHWGQNDAFTGNNTKFPLAAAGVQRWFSIDGATSVLYFTAGAAYRFGPLSIGATGNFISTTVNATTAKTLGTNIPDTSTEGRAFLDAHAFNGSFAVGLMLEAVPEQVWIGASYQAQPGLGQQSLKGELNVTTPTAGTLSTPPPIDFLQSLPDVYRAGIRWRVKHAPLEFRVFGDRTDWSKFTSQCIVLANQPCNIAANGSDNTTGGPVQTNLLRDWKNTYGGRLGVSWWVSPPVELLFGGGYETGASPDSTLAPDLPDANSVQGTFGARFMLTESLFLTASYTQIQYMTRNNEGKSILAQQAFPTAEEDAGGIYKSWIGVLTGNLEALF